MTKAIDPIVVLMQASADIGLQARHDQETFDKAARTRVERMGKAKELVDSDKREVAGFNSIKFKAFAAVGGAYGRAFNDLKSKLARDNLEGVALSFITSMTAKSDDTIKGGGVMGAVKSIIGLGADAERLRAAMQNRLDHWQAMLEAAVAEGNENTAATVALAKRYLVPCGATPDVNGQPKVNDKGKVTLPKHMGRPAATITVGSTKVRIKAGGQTNRESLMAAAAALFAHYGDAVLDASVCDAILDNGGKYVGDTDTVLSHATAARDAIDKLLMLGGNRSGDLPHLTLFASLMERIQREGFKSSHVAADTPEEGDSDVGTESVNNPPPSTTPDVTANPESSDEVQVGSASGDESDPLDSVINDALAGAEAIVNPPATTVNAPVRAAGGARKRGGGL